LAEMAQLVFRERRLQFVGNVNESHAGIIAAHGELPVRRPRERLTADRGRGYK
jgi:hypothetical protein